MLFVPGNRLDRLGRAASAGADELILDLEDSVAQDAKNDARDAVVASLASAPATVRINPTGTPWHDDDLAALASARQLRAVVIPKAEATGDVRAVARRLAPHVLMLPLIETARGLIAARAIAASNAVARVMFGNVDFALDLGITVSTGEPELLHARQELVLASRAARLPGPADGVHLHLDDGAGLRVATVMARNLGFTGKLCVHPRQIPIVHAALRPCEEDLAWARRVVQATVDAPRGASRLDDQLVDEPVLARARRLLESAVEG